MELNFPDINVEFSLNEETNAQANMLIDAVPLDISTEVFSLPSESEFVLDNNNDADLLNGEKYQLFENNFENLFIELYQGGVSRKMCDLIAKTTFDLMNIVDSIIQEVVGDEAKGEVDCRFSILRQIIQDQLHEKKRISQMISNKCFVKPVPVCYGSVLTKIRSENRMIFVNKPKIVYLVPLKLTLKALFGSQVFLKVYNNSHTCTPNIYEKVCCGSNVQTGAFSLIPNEFPRIMIQLYFDGVSIADPLKQHANTYKMGMIYFRVLNLPLELQSLQKNIHLLAIFNETDVKGLQEGYNVIFKHIVDMVIELENGIIISNNSSDFSKLYGSLASTAFDNLACHQVLGMVESFSADHVCCHCYISRADLIQLIDLKDIEKRTSEEFYDGIQTNMTGNIRGIKRMSELCRLAYCKVPDVIGADAFHDLDEGFVKDVIDQSILHLINTKCINNESAFSRIIGFDYGILDQSRRPNNLKHLSGLQYRNIALRFNLIFGDLETQNNKELFQITKLLSKTLQLVYSTRLTDNDVVNLENIVKQLLNLWKLFFPNEYFKPKAHFLLHYSDIVRKLGPLSGMETCAFEMKHRFFTRIAEHSTQFLNISKSFAFKHQIYWSNEWNNNDDFYKILPENPKSIDANDISGITGNIFNSCAPVFIVQSAQLIHKYKAGLCILVYNENCENGDFLLIEAVYMQQNMLVLKCFSVLTSYDDFFAAYKIIRIDSSISFHVVNYCEHPETFAIQRPYNSLDKYILCKRNVNLNNF